MWFRYEKRTRKPTTGGIKSQSKGSKFGSTWWGQRWVEVLEGFDLGARLTRGRSYARSGQVLNIDIESGRVAAKVQGSMPRPYQVTIELPILTDAQWSRVLTELGSSAGQTAKLLAGEMPQEIEASFQKQKVPLFPGRRGDLKTECSCPDDSNPCKHIAAVYYLLAEEFDRDPFLLFRLRGRTRDRMLAELGSLPGVASEEVPAEVLAAEPLPSDPALFWASAPIPAEVFGEVTAPTRSAALLRRLGNFPFWRGELPLVETLEGQYARAAEQGQAVYLGSAET